MFSFAVRLSFIALMRDGAERGQGAASGLYADSSVLRQIIIDKYSATGQNVRLLLQKHQPRVNPCLPPSAPVVPLLLLDMLLIISVAVTRAKLECSSRDRGGPSLGDIASRVI